MTSDNAENGPAGSPPSGLPPSRFGVGYTVGGAHDGPPAPTPTSPAPPPQQFTGPRVAGSDSGLRYPSPPPAAAPPPVQGHDGNWGQASPEQFAGQAYGAVIPKSRTTAGILGLLCGGFGAHSFYLGHTTKGILQIVVSVFTCGIGSLWGGIEGILILVRNQNYLTDARGIPLVD